MFIKKILEIASVRGALKSFKQPTCELQIKYFSHLEESILNIFTISNS